MRTWSGAPCEVVAALERQGIEVVGIDAGVHGARRLPWAVRYHARRWAWSPLAAKRDLALQRTLLSPACRSDLHWDLALRERRARSALAQVQRAGVDTVLHLAPNAVPRQPPPGLRQLLYLDATWESQTRLRQPGGPGRYPPRLVAEGVAHERASFAHVDHVFMQGAWLAGDLEALGVGADRRTAVGTGTTGATRRPTAPREPKRLLVVAKDLLDERGVTTAVEAVQIARQADPDLHLVVIGSGEAVARFGGLPGVEAHAFVPRDRLDEELDRAALLVLPAAYQAWGMIFLEAMAAEVPVVALDRLAIPEITEDGALGFPVAEQDPRLVADAVLDATSDDERLRKLGVAARRSVVRRFTWDGLAAKMAAVIDEGDGPSR